jgi:hypothetical protein
LRIVSDGCANPTPVRTSFSDRKKWRGLLSQKTRRNLELAETVADLADEMERLRAAARTLHPTNDQPYIWCADRVSIQASPTASRSPSTT